MNANQLLSYLDDQSRAIQAAVSELDEIQVAFNAQFDQFKARHDLTLARLTGEVFDRLAKDRAVAPSLRAAIEQRVPEETRLLEERRTRLREEHLSRRRAAADELLARAQAELAHMRELNPKLDKGEEALKRQKAKLEAELTALNETIREKSRGLGVVRHFLDITRADRERHRILGKLEAVNERLFRVRKRWDEARAKIEQNQAALQEQWQLENVAVARLQAELDMLDDETQRRDLAVRRAIHHVLDNLKTPVTGGDPDLDTRVAEMVELNVHTDAYHDGLAGAGGLIGLLRGIDSGLEAIRKSVDGLKHEQEMHSAYLKPLDFRLPDSVEAFHKRWPELARRFVDEKTVAGHPAEFAADVAPLLEGPLSQPSIEKMFNTLGQMIEHATSAW
ncbi:MAG TPA: hypothetical protein VLC95_09855 [Anaerolineae bacterium]|nr:hypothetical protein [Anaerolineae bacterium]